MGGFQQEDLFVLFIIVCVFVVLFIMMKSYLWYQKRNNQRFMVAEPEPITQEGQNVTDDAYDLNALRRSSNRLYSPRTPVRQNENLYTENT